jgi:hypothetical protein
VQGDGFAAAFQIDWETNVQKTVGAYAYVNTMIDRLGLEHFTRYVGGDKVNEAQALLERFRRNYGIAKKLRSGEAVLVGYNEPGSNLLYVGVYKVTALRNLGVAPFVWFLLTAGTLLASASFYFKRWGMEQVDYTQGADRLYLEMARRMQQTVAEVSTTNPVEAARIAEAGAEALRAAGDARRAPKGTLEQIIGATARTGSALLNSPLVWFGLFWAFQRKGRR